jgi:hypothetical protein
MAGTTLQVWNVVTDEHLLDIPGPVARAAISGDGAHIAVHRNSSLEVWDVFGKRQIGRRAAPGALLDLGFASDGRLLAAAGRRVFVWVWRAEALLEAGCERLRINSASAAWSSLIASAEPGDACEPTAAGRIASSTR